MMAAMPVTSAKISVVIGVAAKARAVPVMSIALRAQKAM